MVARSSEIGFSQNTGLPASAAVAVSSACEPVEVATATASQASSSSSNDAVQGTSSSLATFSATTGSASNTQLSRATPHRVARLVACIRPIRPNPASPMSTRATHSPSCLLRERHFRALGQLECAVRATWF